MTGFLVAAKRQPGGKLPGCSTLIDARAFGLGVAVVLLVLRAPFLVVVFGAALSALDFALYAAAGNVSRLHMHQIAGSPLSA